MPKRIVLLKDEYIKFDITTYKKKGYVPQDRYTEENTRKPYWINHRVGDYWGYIDEEGQDWKVVWK